MPGRKYLHLFPGPSLTNLNVSLFFSSSFKGTRAGLVRPFYTGLFYLSQTELKPRKYLARVPDFSRAEEAAYIILNFAISSILQLVYTFTNLMFVASFAAEGYPAAGTDLMFVACPRAEGYPAAGTDLMLGACPRAEGYPAAGTDLMLGACSTAEGYPAAGTDLMLGACSTAEGYPAAGTDLMLGACPTAEGYPAAGTDLMLGACPTAEWYPAAGTDLMLGACPTAEGYPAAGTDLMFVAGPTAEGYPAAGAGSQSRLQAHHAHPVRHLFTILTVYKILLEFLNVNEFQTLKTNPECFNSN
jgi:hypothetical protein